jgi:hypothetical protein
MVDLHHSTLRANPAYELVVSDRLDQSERAALTSDGGARDLYGILRSRGDSELDPRAVSHDTALLFLTMQEPGQLPAYATRVGDPDDVIRLVLDSVLELEHEGRYVSGQQAHELLLIPAEPTAETRPIMLSHAALRYGQALADIGHETLALRLYLFGRRPLTASFRGWLPSEDAVARALGVGDDGPVRAVLGSGWVEEPRARGPAAWRVLRRRRKASGMQVGGGGSKLYVSPAPRHVPAAVTAVAEVLAESPGVVGFKVARDAAGWCRPDKLVCYFEQLEDLHRAATALGPRLTGLPPHGVPFTAPIDSEGLLSWGLDPPAYSGAPGGGRGESWRLRVVRIVAELLATARRTPIAGREPWQVALDRLPLAGIDPETWVPSARVWTT